MGSTKYRCLLVSFFLTIYHSISLFGQSADIIFTNGKIFTSDTNNLYVEAIAIRGNKILAAGNNRTITKFRSYLTKVIDLQGKTVVPGFNDQHDHAAFSSSPVILKYETYDEKNLNWNGLPKFKVLDSIAKLLQIAKPGEWIAGTIGNYVLHDESMRISLDSIAPNNPVILQTWWGHGLVTNQKGLEVAGLNDKMKDPIGGWYTKNSEGKISSVHENAQIPLWWAISKRFKENVISIMQNFSREQLEGGITSTLFMGSSFSYPTITEILKSSSIAQRLRIVSWLRSTTNGRQLSEWPIEEINPTPLSTISGIKYMINHFGPINFSYDTLHQIIQEAYTTKRQLMMHISGNNAFDTVMNLIKSFGSANEWYPLRVRIEHNMIGNPTPNQRKFLKDYGIIIMHTPKYNQPSPLRSLLNDGIRVGIAPDGTTNPFWEIMVITNQQVNSMENISREQAVIAYTKTNAFAEHKDSEKGTLTIGMLADLSVLSQDIFTVPAEKLPMTKSILTMINGKIVYKLIEH